MSLLSAPAKPGGLLMVIEMKVGAARSGPWSGVPERILIADSQKSSRVEIGIGLAGQ